MDGFTVIRRVKAGVRFTDTTAIIHFSLDSTTNKEHR
jgi:hypothetical protein